MSGDRVEQILGDFRGWLDGLTTLPAATPPADPLNLQQLVAQFTALRHDVNMQTKAARTAVEQTNAAMRLLQPTESVTPEEAEEEPASDSEHLRPIVKMLLDVHDALSVAQRQMEKAKRSAGEVLESPAADAKRPGFVARLFGATTPDVTTWQRHADRMREHAGKLQQQFAAVADGYTMSLRRVERTFDELGLETIPCFGEPFDPELMEVLDTATDTGQPAGTVVEVLRQGYIWNDTLLRYAQVKVAK
ncbi:nucleotide exchange factor GrpE [Limnoglobus roseus]|uniref:Protein GrpE n=1 Tax=Limnoglobus roseus TaxID=2598579 RepID=A0A5C1AS30_9BACT|nr:nucleotide exchange factor GrpE [Limnoglobus roseus]